MTALSLHQQIRRVNEPIRVQPTPCECGDHFFAPLSKGFVVLVSLADAEQLTRKWAAAVGPRAVQVTRHGGEPRTTILLSREIMQPEPGFVVDDINCDPTDNRRSNLRVCTQAENARNRRKERNALVPLKGVHFARGRYWAAITKDGRREWLGSFDSAEQAHVAYQAAAERIHGDFARFA